MDPAPLLSPWPLWVQPFLPPARTVLLGVPLALAWAALGALLAGWLRTRRGVPTAYTRKLFHFLIISAAGVVQLVWGLGGVTVFGSVVALVVVHAVWKGDGHPFYEALARPGDAPHRSLFIVVPLLTTALGGVLANVLFSPWAPVAYMVTGWGDAVGEPVGTRWGRHRYRVPSIAGVQVTRSLEGSAAVFLTGTLAAWLILLGMGVPGSSALVVGLACGGAGALVEAFSSHGIDNLTVQLAAGAVAWLLLA
jgi:phytol kinase